MLYSTWWMYKIVKQWCVQAQFLFEEGIQSPIAKSRYDHALLYTKMMIWYWYNESDMNSDVQYNQMGE